MQNNIIESEEGNNTLIYLPVAPGMKRRRAVMLSTVIPGLILIFSVLFPSGETVGSFILRVFSVVAGSLVVVASVMEFRKPGFNRWMGTDMIMVYSGFLILAQGASAFKPHDNFQPAHFLFLAGAIYIFKGVMLPEAKIKKGFLITENEIRYRHSALFAGKAIAFKNLESITKEGNILLFKMKEAGNIKIDLKDSSNKEEIFSELQNALHIKKSRAIS